MVRNASRGVMEFLLINHPLDCPICDQGGECDLQDQAYSYGMDHSRYAENKRAVKDKYLGPLVKTFMTRCIHCTRCIRFSSEVAGVPEMGATSRGESMEVGTYIEKALTTELSGNLIDICPVGALLNKPYSFTARPWELRKTDSIDVHDALGASIRVDSRGSEVLRILPRVNDDVNEEWLGDKSRFSHDGLKRRRLDKCWVRQDGKLRPAAWPEAFGAIAAKLKGLPGERIGAIAGDLCDAESMVALKDLMASLGSANLDCRQDGAALDGSRRDFYLFNTGVARIDEADAILLVGCNPRREAPVLNARIRKRWLSGACPVASIGEPADLTYAVHHLGHDPSALHGLGDFNDVMQAAKRPMVIVGQGALRRPDGAAVLAAAWARGGLGRRADGGVARLQRAAHGRRPGGGARPGLPAGTWRQVVARHARRRRGPALAAGRGRIRHRFHRSGHLRGVPGPPWRPRRRTGGRDPARRRLHRKVGHLDQHRRPRAARLPGRAAAGRGAGGLGDPARLQRRAGQGLGL